MRSWMLLVFHSPLPHVKQIMDTGAVNRRKLSCFRAATTSTWALRKEKQGPHVLGLGGSSSKTATGSQGKDHENAWSLGKNQKKRWEFKTTTNKCLESQNYEKRIRHHRSNKVTENHPIKRWFHAQTPSHRSSKEHLFKKTLQSQNISSTPFFQTQLRTKRMKHPVLQLTHPFKSKLTKSQNTWFKNKQNLQFTCHHITFLNVRVLSNHKASKTCSPLGFFSPKWPNITKKTIKTL